MPHGNADPERGFSINKRILDIHGSSLKEETLEAIRLVKDFLIKCGDIENVNIDLGLLKSCKNARAHYQAYLDRKKEEEQAIRNLEKEKEDKKKSQSERDQLEREKAIILKGIEIAEKSVIHGNSEMEHLLALQRMDREKLIGAQSKISMGVKRKSELSTELDLLEIKISKLK